MLPTSRKVSHVSSAPPRSEPTLLVFVLCVGPFSVFAEAILRWSHYRPLGLVLLSSVALLTWGVVELLVRDWLSDPIRLPKSEEELRLLLDLGGEGAPRGGVAWRRRTLWAIGTVSSTLVLLRAVLLGQS